MTMIGKFGKIAKFFTAISRFFITNYKASIALCPFFVNSVFFVLRFSGIFWRIPQKPPGLYQHIPQLTF